MGIIVGGVVLAIGLAAAACSSANNSARPETNPAESSSSPEIESEHFANVGEATDAILVENPYVRNFAIGENHRRTRSRFASAHEIAAHQIFPRLARHDFRDCVAELLFVNQGLEEEIETFRQTGEYGPNLTRIYREHPDCHGAEALLHSTRDQDMRFYPAGEYSDRSPLVRGFRIRDLSESAILSNLRLGRRVVSMNGAAHNDLDDWMRTTDGISAFPYSFLQPLGLIRRLLRRPGEVIELDLQVGDLRVRNDDNNEPDIFHFPNRESYFPEEGVNLVRVLGYPRYIMFVSPVISEEAGQNRPSSFCSNDERDY